MILAEAPNCLRNGLGELRLAAKFLQTMRDCPSCLVQESGMLPQCVPGSAFLILEQVADDGDQRPERRGMESAGRI